MAWLVSIFSLCQTVWRETLLEPTLWLLERETVTVVALQHVPCLYKDPRALHLSCKDLKRDRVVDVMTLAHVCTDTRHMNIFFLFFWQVFVIKIVIVCALIDVNIFYLIRKMFVECRSFYFPFSGRQYLYQFRGCRVLIIFIQFISQLLLPLGPTYQLYAKFRKSPTPILPHSLPPVTYFQTVKLTLTFLHHWPYYGWNTALINLCGAQSCIPCFWRIHFLTENSETDINLQLIYIFLICYL